MKQEMIDLLREESGKYARVACAVFWNNRADILAVLEAARDYAQAEERSLAQYEGETVPPLDDRIAANRARNKAHDALLALIDLSDDLRVLGGTK